jgi:hypothetical protein
MSAIGSEGEPVCCSSTKPSISTKRIFQAADSILEFSSNLVRFSFRLELPIAEDLPRHFFDCPSGLLSCAFNTIIIHRRYPFMGWKTLDKL